MPNSFNDLGPDQLEKAFSDAAEDARQFGRPESTFLRARELADQGRANAALAYEEIRLRDQYNITTDRKLKDRFDYNRRSVEAADRYGFNVDGGERLVNSIRSEATRRKDAGHVVIGVEDLDGLPAKETINSSVRALRAFDIETAGNFTPSPDAVVDANGKPVASGIIDVERGTDGKISKVTFVNPKDSADQWAKQSFPVKDGVLILPGANEAEVAKINATVDKVAGGKSTLTLSEFDRVMKAAYNHYTSSGQVPDIYNSDRSQFDPAKHIQLAENTFQKVARPEKAQIVDVPDGKTIKFLGVVPEVDAQYSKDPFVVVSSSDPKTNDPYSRKLDGQYAESNLRDAKTGKPLDIVAELGKSNSGAHMEAPVETAVTSAGHREPTQRGGAANGMRTFGVGALVAGGVAVAATFATTGDAKASVEAGVNTTTGGVMRDVKTLGSDAPSGEKAVAASGLGVTSASVGKLGAAAAGADGVASVLGNVVKVGGPALGIAAAGVQAYNGDKEGAGITLASTAVGTVVGAVATPPVGIAAAVVTQKVLGDNAREVKLNHEARLLDPDKDGFRADPTQLVNDGKQTYADQLAQQKDKWVAEKAKAAPSEQAALPREPRRGNYTAINRELEQKPTEPKSEASVPKVEAAAEPKADAAVQKPRQHLASLAGPKF